MGGFLQYWNGAWIEASGGGKTSVLDFNVEYKKFFDAEQNGKWGLRCLRPFFYVEK
jgi:hypothetical protein